MSINRFLNRATVGIIAGALILSFASLISRVLGFLRNALLAASFGAGEILDAYFLAFRLPDLFFNLLFFGALSAGFVPVFMKLREKDDSQAWQLANDIFNLALLAFSIFGIAFFFAAPWVLKQIAPGFNEATMALSVTMSRIMFLQPIFLGISGIFSGILQSTHKFLAYSLAPIFYNLGIIFGILVAVPIIGPVGLAWGVVLGALMHLLVQYPATRESGWRWRPVLRPGMKALQRVLKVMVPRSLALIVQQVNLIVLVSLATVLGAGSVAVFNFANDLYGFPLGVVVVPLSVAAFPAFVRSLNKSKDSLAKIFTQTLRQLLFVIVPLGVLAFILRAQVVRLTLGYGEFGWQETVLTINTFTFLLIGLLFHAVLGLLLRAYFALEDAKTPLIVLLGGTAVMVISALFLRDLMGVAGLALALSIGVAFNAAVLLVHFVRVVGSIKVGEIVRSFLVFLFAAIIAGLMARMTLFFVAENLVVTHRVWGLLVQAILGTVVGTGTYLLLTWLLNVPEVEALRVKLRLGRAKEVIFEELPEEEMPR